jgi:hypothetical protein
MSDPIDYGGRAFPTEQGHIPEGTWNQTYDPGMSLRDYFAAHANEAESIVNAYCLTNLEMKQLVGDGGELSPLERHIMAVAKVRVMLADAMLKARRAGQ